jgi:hypothetical protein
MEFGKSWLDKLTEAQAELAAPKDPWKRVHRFAKVDRLRRQHDLEVRP